MTKKYLSYFFIVFTTHNGFGDTKILVAAPLQKPYLLETKDYPKDWRLKYYRQNYSTMIPAFQCIIDYLRPEHKDKAKSWHYIKISLIPFVRDKEYEFFRFSDDPSNPLYKPGYCFEWKHKSYGSLTAFEKQVADFYSVKRGDISFLYPYKRSDKDVTGKIDNIPWAIETYRGTHSILWRETTLQDSKNSIIDPFLVVEDKDQGKNIKILVDEKNNILAKSIDGTITFRSK